MLTEPSVTVPGDVPRGALILSGKFGIPESHLSIPLHRVEPEHLDVLCQVATGYLNVWGADGRNFSAKMTSRLRRDLRRAARQLRSGPARVGGLREALTSMTATLRMLL